MAPQRSFAVLSALALVAVLLVSGANGIVKGGDMRLRKIREQVEEMAEANGPLKELPLVELPAVGGEKDRKVIPLKVPLLKGDVLSAPRDPVFQGDLRDRVDGKLERVDAFVDHKMRKVDRLIDGKRDRIADMTGGVKGRLDGKMERIRGGVEGLGSGSLLDEIRLGHRPSRFRMPQLNKLDFLRNKQFRLKEKLDRLVDRTGGLIGRPLEDLDGKLSDVLDGPLLKGGRRRPIVDGKLLDGFPSSRPLFSGKPLGLFDGGLLEGKLLGKVGRRPRVFGKNRRQMRKGDLLKGKLGIIDEKIQRLGDKIESILPSPRALGVLDSLPSSPLNLESEFANVKNGLGGLRGGGLLRNRPSLLDRRGSLLDRRGSLFGRSKFGLLKKPAGGLLQGGSLFQRERLGGGLKLGGIGGLRKPFGGRKIGRRFGGFGGLGSPIAKMKLGQLGRKVDAETLSHVANGVTAGVGLMLNSDKPTQMINAILRPNGATNEYQEPYSEHEHEHHRRLNAYREMQLPIELPAVSEAVAAFDGKLAGVASLDRIRRFDGKLGGGLRADGKGMLVGRFERPKELLGGNFPKRPFLQNAPSSAFSLKRGGRLQKRLHRFDGKLGQNLNRIDMKLFKGGLRRPGRFFNVRRFHPGHRVGGLLDGKLEKLDGKLDYLLNKKRRRSTTTTMAPPTTAPGSTTTTIVATTTEAPASTTLSSTGFSSTGFSSSSSTVEGTSTVVATTTTVMPSSTETTTVPTETTTTVPETTTTVGESTTTVGESTTTAAPETTTAAPETTTSEVPESTTAAPETTTTVAGETTTAASETTTAASETTTAAPETTTAAPETTTAAPETTTAAPETTTAAPETTTAAPETTTAAPESTTVAPETTTAAAETTTEVGESTTVTETTTAAPESTSVAPEPPVDEGRAEEEEPVNPLFESGETLSGFGFQNLREADILAAADGSPIGGSLIAALGALKESGGNDFIYGGADEVPV